MWTKQFVSGDCPQHFENSGFADWIRAIGSGTVSVVNGDNSAATFDVTGGEIITGKFRSITAVTCTRVWAGDGIIPPAPGQKGDRGATGPTGATGAGAGVPTAPTGDGEYDLVVSSGVATWTSVT